jgi:hypothetical protein
VPRESFRDLWSSGSNKAVDARIWSVKQAAIGFRVHSGWAAAVAVSVEKGAPQVLARQRVHLVETFTYEFR